MFFVKQKAAYDMRISDWSSDVCASDRGLNITVLILNDNGYGMIRWKQANMGFKDWGLTYGNPDFVKYAEAYGAHGHRVESAAHLKELLAHTRDTPGVHLINCPVDYSENDQILNNDIKRLSKEL